MFGLSTSSPVVVVPLIRGQLEGSQAVRELADAIHRCAQVVHAQPPTPFAELPLKVRTGYLDDAIRLMAWRDPVVKDYAIDKAAEILEQRLADETGRAAMDLDAFPKVKHSRRRMVAAVLASCRTDLAGMFRCPVLRRYAGSLHRVLTFPDREM